MSNLATTETIQKIVNTLSQAQITPVQLTEAFDLTAKVKKYVEKLYELGRDKTLEYLKEYGQPYGGGSLKAVVGHYELNAVTTGSGYDDKKVEALLRTKGLQPESGMDVTISYKTNVEKLCRVLNDNELSACKKKQDYRVNAPKPVNESEE